jgi:predicted acylesterase/phospholipase RssA
MVLSQEWNRPPRNLIRDNLPQYLRVFVEDGGMFSGWSVRRYLDYLVARKTLDPESGRPIRNLTFAEHRAYHRVDLVVTGTEYLSRTSHYFSADTTPHFAIADAVRISMGFPIVYKPVEVSAGPLVGYWGDGGILNNTPIHAFDRQPGKGPINDEVLGVRLEREGRDMFASGFTIVASLLSALGGSGEWSQVRTKDEEDQTVILDTTGLDTLDFAPNDDTVNAAALRAWQDIMGHFGQDASPSVFPFLKLFGDRATYGLPPDPTRPADSLPTVTQQRPRLNLPSSRLGPRLRERQPGEILANAQDEVNEGAFRFIE